MSGVRAQKKQQTRRAIEEAAVELFSCKGFDATSMEDIAHAAGVGKATIYGYFPAKDDIFLQYCDDRLVIAFNQFKEQHSKEISFVEYLIAFFMIKFVFITENREFGRLLLREMLFPKEPTDKAREHNQRYFDILEGVFCVAEERGEIAPNQDHFTLSGHFFSLYVGLLAGWYSGYFDSLEEVEKSMRTLFHQVCHGIIS
ncbi:MAG: TetR/AcrR family transcriptional regulator [Desulfuromonadales bacterium]|nr:TetR/AcrR family transcriptional regulator [Desulfuromonadales bacterium]